MGSQKNGSDGGDPEDIPSDFFDDFNKDEFMQGLSVVDSWDEEDTGKRRIDAEALDSVKDLRELIEGKDDDRCTKGRHDVKFDSKYKWEKGRARDSSGDNQRSSSRNKLDDYIKPGSRRDPNKTNEAIKKDKEVKVKELLAKHLDDDLRPPGTELDDYYNEGKPTEKRKSPVMEAAPPRRRSREYHRSIKMSPPRHRRPIFRSPRREYQRRSPHRSPVRMFSPQRKFRRYSPPRRSPRRFSPIRRSPRRASPLRRSPRRKRRTRSPPSFHETYDRHSASPGSYHRDTFLYPNNPSSSYSLAAENYSKGPYPGPTEYTGGPQGFPYPQGPPYGGGYGPSGYEYGGQPQLPAINLPQPVPAPAIAAIPMNPAPVTPTPAPVPLMNIATTNPAPLMNSAPSMVPAPAQISPSGSLPDGIQPYDALAQVNISNFVTFFVNK